MGIPATHASPLPGDTENPVGGAHPTGWRRGPGESCSARGYRDAEIHIGIDSPLLGIWASRREMVLSAAKALAFVVSPRARVCRLHARQ